MLPDTPLPWLGLSVALGNGLLIGLERERRKGTGPGRKAAGIRTHALVSLLGAISALLGSAMLAVAAAGVVALTAVSHWRSRDEDPGLTSEIALLLTFALGAWAISAPAWAAGAGVLVAVLLAAREPMHRFVRDWLTAREVQDLLLLAVATLLVLPIVPDGGYGPWQSLHPRTLWTVVILVMAISAVGHIALRVLGRRWGLPLAGLFGGFVSSTATVAAMGQRVRDEPGLMRGALAGAVLSTVATMVQLALILLVTGADALAALALPLAAAGATALLAGALLMRSALAVPHAAQAGGTGGAGHADTGAAFSLRSALLLAALMGAMAMLAAGLERHFGHLGLALGAAVGGFADAHAPAASVGTLVAAGALGADAAALPVLLALSTNTLSKCLVAATGGGRAYAWRVAPVMLTVMAAAWLGWWMG